MHSRFLPGDGAEVARAYPSAPGRQRAFAHGRARCASIFASVGGRATHRLRALGGPGVTPGEEEARVASMWRLGPLFFGLLVACDANGLGRVDARFFRAECPPDVEESGLRNFGFDAGYLSTDRFRNVLILNVQEYNVDILETDSMGARIDLEGLERAGLLSRAGAFFVPTAPPLRVPVGTTRTDAQVILSLYRTCERFPGYSAVNGEVVFDDLRIRIDGEDTGDAERLAGRMTGTLSYVDAPSPIATATATFDFSPPSRPLREFE